MGCRAQAPIRHRIAVLKRFKVPCCRPWYSKTQVRWISPSRRSKLDNKLCGERFYGAEGGRKRYNSYKGFVKGEIEDGSTINSCCCFPLAVKLVPSRGGQENWHFGTLFTVQPLAACSQALYSGLQSSVLDGMIFFASAYAPSVQYSPIYRLRAVQGKPTRQHTKSICMGRSKSALPLVVDINPPARQIPLLS
jgi:hypothetical protein